MTPIFHFFSGGRIGSRIGLIIGLAAVYYVTGRLGLLLALPPGYATAIWPPSGLALAALLILGYGVAPGVLLGSFILNVHWDAADLGATMIDAEMIAAGSTLQVMVGAWLVRRVVSLPTTLEKPVDILGVGLLGGPVACLIAATIGVTALSWRGAIPADSYALTWFTWWTGDTIGVLVFTPLALLLFQPKSVGISLRRKALLAVPIAALFCLTVYVFFAVSAWETEKRQLAFDAHAESAMTRLQGNLKDYEDNLFSIGRFYDSSDYVSRHEFSVFTKYSFARFPGIYSLGWVERVTPEAIQDFVKRARKDVLPDYRITQFDDKVSLKPGITKGDYFPLLYIEPQIARNETVLGFDLSTDPARREAIMRAAATGAVSVTGRITLLQDVEKKAAFLMLQPVYAEGGVYETPESRLAHLKGFVFEAFRIDAVLQPVLDMFDKGDVDITLADLSAAGGVEGEPLYGSRHDKDRSSAYRWEKNFEFGGRVWSFRVTQTPSYILTHKSWESWIILAGGLCMTGMMGLLFLIVTGQTDVVRRTVEERTKELRNSEETFRQAIDYASIGMAFVAPNGRWLRVNSALCNLVGYSADEMLSINFKKITHPDDLENNLSLVRQMVGGEIQSYQMEKRYYHKDGHIIWVLLNVSMIRNDDGSPKYFIAQMQDISARKEIDRVKNEFISTVSHELRTPLTSIRGSLGLIVGGAMGALPDKVLGLVDIAHKNSERLIHLVNDILDIEKIEAGKLDIEIKPIEVRSFLQQVAEMNKGYAEKYQVRFVVEDIAGHYMVLADYGRLMQVMANLLSNAAKFSQAGSEVMIRLESRSHQKLRFMVIDRGQGVPEEFRSRIFEKFVQADNSSTRRYEGAGLGLSISRRLVEAMNGQIGFASDVGKGSTFYIDLPVIQEHRQVIPFAAKKESVPVMEAAPPRILHIEDDHDLASIMKNVIGARASMVNASSLAQAEKIIAAERFDLIILDLALPDGSGGDFLERLPQLISYKIPVLILSASEADSAMQNTVAASLVKSRLSEEHIVETIFHVIRQAAENYQGTA